MSRFSGEGWDRSSNANATMKAMSYLDKETIKLNISGIFENGDFYLTTREKAMVAKVKESFEDVVVVMNIGGIIGPFLGQRLQRDFRRC